MADQESSDLPYALLPEAELRRLAESPPSDPHLRAQLAAELLHRAQDRRVTGRDPDQAGPISTLELSMKRVPGWLLNLAAPLCLAPLVVVALRAPTLVPQSSFAMWVGLELVILVSAGLAICLSLWRFRERSAGLKVLAVATIVVAGALGPLEAFWFL